MSKVTNHISFHKLSLQNWVRLPLALALLKSTKTALFGENVFRLNSPRTTAGVIFLCFCVSDSEPLKCDILGCVARSARDGILTKKRLYKIAPGVQRILYYVTFFFFIELRFLVMSRKLDQITQVRWDWNFGEMVWDWSLKTFLNLKVNLGLLSQHISQCNGMFQ